MKEATHVWTPLRDNFKKLEPRIHLQRLESSVGNGVPDVNGCLAGRDFWLELKLVTGNQVKLTPLQAAWLKTRAEAGGRSFVLARKGDTFRLWHGEDAPAVRETGWSYPPLWELAKPWDWRSLLAMVTGRWREVYRKPKYDPNAPLPGQLPMFA